MASKVDCKVFKGPTNHHRHHPPAGQTGGVDRRAGSEKVPSLHINRMFFTLPTQRAIHSPPISSPSLDMKSELVARTRQFADPVLASWSNKFSPTTEANDKYKMTIMTESIQCGAHGKEGGTGTARDRDTSINGPSKCVRCRTWNAVSKAFLKERANGRDDGDGETSDKMSVVGGCGSLPSSRCWGQMDGP